MSDNSIEKRLIEAPIDQLKKFELEVQLSVGVFLRVALVDSNIVVSQRKEYIEARAKGFKPKSTKRRSS